MSRIRRCIGILPAVMGLLLSAPTSAQEAAARVVEIGFGAATASGPALDATARGGPVLRVRQGERIALRWTSDRPMALHIHGYGIEAMLEAGRTSSTVILARAAGRFPVETHRPGGGHATLFYLEVHPR